MLPQQFRQWFAGSRKDLPLIRQTVGAVVPVADHDQ
jgi:hypothetical protein